MTTIGGTDFIPGAPNTLTLSGLDITQAAATFRWEALSVAGTLDGTDWVFVFSEADSGYFEPVPNRFDVSIVYTDGSVSMLTLLTGERKVGTVPSTPKPSTTVTSVTAAGGLTATPSNPITDTGTISLSSEDVMPEPGALNQITLNQKAWSVDQDALAPVVRRTFYQAIDDSGPTGTVTLVASGIEAVVRWGGWLQDGANDRRYSIPSTSLATSAGLLVAGGILKLNRGTSVDDTDDGYLVVIDLIEIA